MDKYNVLWIQFIQSSFSKGFQQGHFLKALKENKLSCYKTEMEIQKKKKRELHGNFVFQNLKERQLKE